MDTLIYEALFIFLVICGILHFYLYRKKNLISEGNNPAFIKFQRGYFLAYLPALFADWLQGPYLYQLYSHYGFEEPQIAVLYVFGFASTVILGTWTPLAADQFGRKKLCLIFTVLYSLSCFLKLSTSYGVLIIGRILGGVATSVLFSAFEAWYVHEHTEIHDFPKEWIQVTFAKASVWNGILSILAGIFANVFSQYFGLGPVAPYMAAVPFLVLAGVIVGMHWSENRSINNVRFKKICKESSSMIVMKEDIFLLGVIEALFESVMYIVIFLWTPVLQPVKPAYGIVFSVFMTCILTGQGIFTVFTSFIPQRFKIQPQSSLLLAIGLGTISNLMLVLSTNPHLRNLEISFMGFCMFQLAVGIYFPSMRFLRNCIIPDTHRWGIVNWFRVPITTIACIVLMLLHEDAFQHGNSNIFLVCLILLLLATVCNWRFHAVMKNDERLIQEYDWIKSDHLHTIF